MGLFAIFALGASTASAQTGFGLQSVYAPSSLTTVSAIIAQNQFVSDLPANGKSRQSGDRKRVHHLIAKPKSPLGLWREGTAEAHGTLLLGFYIGPQERFILSKRHVMATVRFSKLA